ncbi:YcnI family protein [Nocardioides limicola]|uniref:YcnI family protein n=1 Tax=Nocardioides limicola TaxID=2803368 RepID=UPI00193BE0E0|nr:YcnI family protein [Nocardioides sp. DJM-14]
MPVRSMLAATAVAGLAAVALAGPAAAHVTVDPTTTDANSYAVLTVSVPHGCDGSATTEVAIRIPEQITSVTATRHPLWDVRVETETLDEPITDAHGNTVTERDAMVVYRTDSPLPDGQRDAFELSVRLPDAADDTLVFPTVQTCERGEAAWIQVPADGQDAHDLDYPAPSFVLTEAAGHGHGDDGPATDEHATDEQGTDEASAAVTTGGALPWLGLGAGLLGMIAGGAALLRVRRPS